MVRYILPFLAVASLSFLVFLGSKLDDRIFGAVNPTYFAEIDSQGTVLRVIVADQAFIDSGKVGDPSRWKQTYIDGVKNYAGKGDKYDIFLNDFISPKPHPSATLEGNKWRIPSEKSATST